MNAVLAGALDLLYPRNCISCGKCVEGEAVRHLCWECARLVRYQSTESYCTRCGRDMPGPHGGEYLCSLCRKTPPSFDLARSAAHFEGPTRALIHALKYKKGDYLVPDLTDLLEACFGRHYLRERLDVICPIPLHPDKLRARGYNQAALLAVELGRRLKLPVLPDALLRVRNTPTQTFLNAAQRRANMKQAFCENPVLKGWVSGRRVLLLDDVMTTGSTLSEAASALRAAGASRINALTVARD